MNVLKKDGHHDLLDSMQRFDKPVSRITGVGSFVPETVVDNSDIAERIKGPEKLRKRLAALIERTTLVRERHYSDPTLEPSDLGLPAVHEALEKAGKTVADVDLLIFAATDMDQLEPATANILQHKLGIPRVNSFDVSNACNSFLQAVNVTNSLIATGQTKCAVICAAETGSQWVNFELEKREELQVKMGGLTLGDAAGAVVMEPADDSGRGIQEINLFALGEYSHLCHAPENPAWRKQTPHNIHGWFYLDMAGLAKAVRPLTLNYFREYWAFRRAAHGEEDFTRHIDKVIPHQISRKLITEFVQALDADPALVAITADEYGNTASAAIPFTLHHTMEQQQLALNSDQEIIMFGAASGLGMGHIRVRL